MANPVTEGYVTTDDIDVDIDLEKIVQGVNNWDGVIKAVELGISRGLDELCDRIKAKMLEYLTMYGLGASSIASDIRVKRTSTGLVISVGSDYAIYVEYGTGVVGSQNPHPHPEIPWIYNEKEQGWFYPTTQADPNPNKHYYNGQLYGWTKGQKSRPFMYQTWLWTTRSATQIIRKNIRREVKKVKGVK